MKKLLIAAVLASTAAMLPMHLGAQVNEQLAEFEAVLPIDGLPLVAVHMNDRTTALLFQPPTLYAMRAKAKEVTCLYVQGVADKAMELNTDGFSIDQDGGSSSAGTPISMHNFTKGKVKLMKGDRVDGVLTFSKLFKVTQAFTLKYGGKKVDFNLGGSVDHMRAPEPAK